MSNEDFDAEKFLKMYKTVNSLIKSESEQKIDDSGQQTDLEKMLKTFKMLKSMQPMLDTTVEDTAKPLDAVQYRFDPSGLEAKIQTPELLTIKAAIPYLEGKYQKNLSVFIKLIEIQRLLDYYRDTAIEYHGGYDEFWREKMLMSIRPLFEPQRRHKIDILIKALEIDRLSKKMNIDFKPSTT